MAETGIEVAAVLTTLTALGYIASALMVAAFWMRAPFRLRQMAIASNIAFFAYALAGRVWPLAALQAVLLPLNVWRLWELHALTQRVKTALSGDLSMEWLQPFMTRRQFAAGEFIFRKGDSQTDVYCVLSGTVRLPEVEVTVGPGELLGEMAIFSPTLERTLSAVCVTDVEILHMPTEALLKLYYRNPEFGIYLVRLITRRLLEDTHILADVIRTRTNELDRLKAFTDVDPATGIANLRAFQARLHMEWGRGIRSPAPLSLIVARIEDRYDRRWSDETLAQVAIALGACASRASDLLARHDREFVAILPGTTLEGARAIAEEMTRAIEALDVPAASVWAGDMQMRSGVATCVPERGVPAETLLEHAYKDLCERWSPAPASLQEALAALVAVKPAEQRVEG
jgi:CRP/FNR family cyclic AMP-dependent transcriptional regulator